MKQNLYKFTINILRCFSGKNLILHLSAILLSYAIVASGFDWIYFKATRSEQLQILLFPAVIIGSLGTFVLIITLFLIGKIQKNEKILKSASAIFQAAAIGIIISSFYKSITGRAHPEILSPQNLIDTSQIFKFGFMNGGIFWGWPSGHTTVAFAISVTIFLMYKKSKYRYLALFYAFYIGVGISTNIHWFSDFIAGALIGTSIGTIIGNNFSEKNTGDYVILLHGLGRTSFSMKGLQEHLTKEGYQTINIDYPSRKHTIENLSKFLEKEVLKNCQDPSKKIHFVTHSLGGIIVRYYLSKNKLKNLGNVLMLAPPNKGSDLAQSLKNSKILKNFMGPALTQLGTDHESIPLKLPNPYYNLFVIGGEKDGKVSVERMRVDKMTDFLIVPGFHTFIMNSKKVKEAVSQFLKT